MGAETKATAIHPFKIQFPERQIKAMLAGIESAAVPDHLDDDDASAGLRLGDFRALIQYWQHKYSWAKEQDALNQFAQFQTEIQGVNLHFIHERSRHDQATAIIMLHGWPSGPFEFRKVLPRLTAATRPQDSFHVVAPSMPGFMMSAPSTSLDYTQIARLYLQLMERLGYERYLVYGTDLGQLVACMMVSADAGRHCLGLHLQGGLAMPRLSLWTPFRTMRNLIDLLRPATTPLERLLWNRTKAILTGHLAYLFEHMTEPRSMGLVVAQAPAATAVWVAARYVSWSDATGVVIDADMTDDERLRLYERKLDCSLTRLEHCQIGLDEILTTITLFWLTGTLPTSMWFYRNSLWRHPWAAYTQTEIVQVPVAISKFACDLWMPDALLRQQFHQLIQTKFHPNGGHFASLEQPDDVANDIIEFSRRLQAQ